MRLLQALCIFMLALVPLVGCRQTIVLHAPPTTTSALPTRQVGWANHFLFGFVGHKAIDLRDHCVTSAVERVTLSDDALTLLVTIATVGIYVPRRVVITCAESTPP